VVIPAVMVALRSSRGANHLGGGSDGKTLTREYAAGIGRTPYGPNEMCLGGTT